jgi:N-acylneuraminate cytidylyltransferase
MNNDSRQPIVRYIIPARAGSKGVPHKNRTLVPRVLAGMAKDRIQDSILTTDDCELIAWATGDGYSGTILNRPACLATDTASMKDVLKHAVGACGLPVNTVLVVLYPTYPVRPWGGVYRAIEMVKYGATSVLGRMECVDHPYRCVVAGMPVADKSFYRRQQYPEAWVFSHVVCVLRAGILPYCTDNLWHPSTQWIDVPRCVDVDTPEDMEAATNQ